MGKIKVGKLNPGDLFEYRGVIYEVIYMAGWSVRCGYVNDKSLTDLYCDFSIHTIVEI